MMRAPDFIIGGRDNPYLNRWYLIPRNRLFNIYLHQFIRSDDDRALHDHPWVNVSILLRGRYLEHTRTGIRQRRAGQVCFRRAVAAHRIELIDEKPVWTLFLTGPKIREWGFHCPQGWRHWKIFTGGSRGETIGRGCN